MEETANLNLPYIMPSQAQKHVTHNEALVLLDAVVQLSVHARNNIEPPLEAADGVRHLVPDDATGEWADWSGSIALRLDGGWRKIDPVEGWIAWVVEEDILVVWDGEVWIELADALPRLKNLERFGLGTEADADNPFAAKLNKALWTALGVAEGGDGNLRYTLNKETAPNFLSVLMQTGWTGTAEFGLIGDNDFSCKVSEDGEIWREGFRIDHETGRMSFPNTPALDALHALTGSAGSFLRYTGEDSATVQPIVGIVSQSAGTPTGAIVERGSNANGTFIRFADGTQICRHRAAPTISIDTAFGGGFRSAPQTWTFPAEFAADTEDEIAVNASAGPVSHSVQAVATSASALRSGIICSRDRQSPSNARPA
jgi:hypothetical protein